MPLYPLVAVAVGWFVERCSAAEIGSLPRRRWNIFLLGVAIAGLVGAGGLLVASLIPNPTGLVAVVRQTPDRCHRRRWQAPRRLPRCCSGRGAPPGALAVEIGVLAVAGYLGAGLSAAR